MSWGTRALTYASQFPPITLLLQLIRLPHLASFLFPHLHNSRTHIQNPEAGPSCVLDGARNHVLMNLGQD